MNTEQLQAKVEELQAKVEELEEALDEKETPAAEVYELRKACRIYKELVQEKKAKVEELEADVRGLKAQIFECENNECFTGHVGDFLYPKENKS